MSATKHTPGPWSVGNTDPLLFGSPRGNGTEPIGYVYGPSFAERSEFGQRAIANARLIAAAPDLLDALLSLLHSADDHSAYMSAVKDARAAVAKATGGAL